MSASVKYQLPYGKSDLIFSLPDDREADIIAPAETMSAPNPLELVNIALDTPLGGQRLEQLVTGFDKPTVAVAINDKTRPVPHQFLLPPLLGRLETLGIAPHAITLFIATGTHPPMQEQEFPSILPFDILDRYPVISHDARDESRLTFLGTTQRGTPVWVNRRFFEADLRIVVGNISPHQFMGFSGGVKSAAIGLAGMPTVNHNHAMMIDPASRLGEYETNPTRQDVEEIGELIGVHFALNAILNEAKEIVRVLAGEPRAVMQAGIPLSRQLCQSTVSGLYRLVIASPGGHPKDINLYQAQKGLAHACMITHPGATVILAAACPEGTGSRSYETWMQGITFAERDPPFEQIFKRFRQEGFRIGPHKAFQIARDASQVHLFFYSEMPPDFARSLLLNPIQDLQTTIESALATLSPGERIAIMPRAASTIPFVADRKLPSV